MPSVGMRVETEMSSSKINYKFFACKKMSLRWNSVTSDVYFRSSGFNFLILLYLAQGDRVEDFERFEVRCKRVARKMNLGRFLARCFWRRFIIDRKKTLNIKMIWERILHTNIAQYCMDQCPFHINSHINNILFKFYWRTWKFCPERQFLYQLHKD